jgi:hypothetical protein
MLEILRLCGILLGPRRCQARPAGAGIRAVTRERERDHVQALRAMEPALAHAIAPPPPVSVARTHARPRWTEDRHQCTVKEANATIVYPTLTRTLNGWMLSMTG